MSTEAAPLLHTCPSCGTILDVSEVEPFSQVHCPSCGLLQRVRSRFDHFELIEEIASGGMGTVYRAMDVNLNRVVALKLLRKEYSEDADYIAKLGTEAKLTASVTHPFVVKVFSFGCDQGVYYIAMELVDKGSLDDLMALQGKVAEAQVLEIGLQVAQGLRAAFRVGLIHRDVKPGNILFADAHTAKIVDFGLALPLEQAKEGEAEIWGTPYYVAPEKLNHEPEDFRSDIYSLGGTLFHALAGRPPFEAENASLVALKHLKSQVVSLQAFAPDVSSPTAYVINRMQAKNPDDRYASYDELIEHLEYARSELLGSAGKVRQRKARLVVETEKQQNVFGYILLAGIVFTAVMGGILYAYKDTIISRRSGVDDVARMRLERSLGNVDQTLARVRKELAAGNAQTAILAVQTLEGRADVPETSKVWVGLHECAARLLDEQFWKAREIVTQLLEKKAYKRENRGEEEQLQRFLTSLGTLMRTRGKVSDPSMNNWAKGTFEPLGYFLAGLKEWDAARFDAAADFFQKFLACEPKENWLWIAELKPLAQKAHDDAAVFQTVRTLVSAADTPEKKAAAANRIAVLKGKCKLPGRLPEELAIYEAGLRAAPDPGGQATRASVTALLERMQPAEAARQANTLRDAAAQKALSQKAACLAELQKALIEDLNRFTTNRWLARRSGPAMAVRIVQADENAIQVQPLGGGEAVSVPWSDIMPSSVLTWTDSVFSAKADLLWEGGVYAAVAGYPREAQARGARAVELHKEYAPLLSLLQ